MYNNIIIIVLINRITANNKIIAMHSSLGTIALIEHKNTKLYNWVYLELVIKSIDPVYKTIVVT